ncbi:MAG: tyrosine-protein phosphatase [SAR202 cluster bacterium]|nr:tyrosine-protein phosphatase [SAR202 cluster bacterium]
MDDLFDSRRHIKIDGIYNLRDIGGYRTRDNRRTRWRAFFRSDSPHRLTPEAQATLLSHGIKTVVDFRDYSHKSQWEYRLGENAAARYVHLDLLGERLLADWLALEEQNGGRLLGNQVKTLTAMYRRTIDERQEQIAATMSALARPGAMPAMVHCVVGKDRTGLVSALSLGLVGVPEETIAQDYALSGRCLVESYHTYIKPPGLTPATYTWEHYQRDFCPPEVMLSTLDHIIKTYGGVAEYLLTAGVTEQQLNTLRRALVE